MNVTNKLMLWGCLLVAHLTFFSDAMGNAITLGNFSYNQAAQTVSFDVEWQNSWRVDSTALPFNWDAAWIFVKFRECGVPSTTPWTHAKIDTNATSNNFGSLEPIAANGSSFYPDSAGVMLRRQTNGLFGAAAATTVTLTLANLPLAGQFDIKVFGLEMVWVPEGSYQLGAVTSSNSFAATSTSTDVTPVSISNESSQTINAHIFGANGSVTLPAAFPKGFAGFYIMKYEISQQQYAGFLNTLSSLHQTPRYTGNFNANRNRLGAFGVYPDIYTTNRPDRTQNYLGWDDVAAYLDWAALRPLTELEYEKTCRGSNPMVANEYAWGNTNIIELTNISTPENGTEVSLVSNANCHYLNNALTGGDGGFGPVRTGIFALPTTPSREAAGGAFFGVLELSGNLWEPFVAVRTETSTTGAVAFDGTWGDGNLGANGRANVTGWPSVANATQGWIRRGGAYNSGTASLRVSDRGGFTWNGSRDQYTGGRGGR